MVPYCITINFHGFNFCASDAVQRLFDNEDFVITVHQECITERERRVSHSAYNYAIDHPWQGFMTFQCCQ